MLLARYQMDIEYFLNHGNRSERNLFFGTEAQAEILENYKTQVLCTTKKDK